MLNVFLYLNKEEKWKQTTGQDEDENMKIIETYGNYIEKWSNENPGRARWLLKTGWKAQNLKFRFAPDKRLMPAEQYLARLMMDTMIRPLERPEESAIVSIFTPCEILQEAGLHPYNVEGFSCYLSASKAERAFLQQAENTGISETLCSYHKTFIGAAQKKVLPKPKCIVYTNLTCDANLLTFKKLAKMYDVPIFAIDVPMQQNEDNVQYVADQLRKLKDFIEECTGKKITDETLTERLRRSKRTLEKFAQYEKESADRYIPADLVTPLYAGMTNNLLLGTEEEETYVDRLLNDVKKAPAKKGKKIYWMHTIEAMARRMVYHALNGSAIRRIEAGICHAKETGADGVVWFGHWGCKHTLGAAQLAKRKFEEQGIPLLILDGDGCDRSHGGEGQTSTRLGAFLEMLNTETDENTDRQEESHDE